MDLACPACGFVVLSEGYGSYDICPVCDWQDDGVQLRNPTSGGGANQRSLANVQDEVLARIPVGVMSYGEFRRDPLRRPLNAEEIAAAETRRRSQHWHSAMNEPDAYWLREPASSQSEGGA